MFSLKGPFRPVKSKYRKKDMVGYELDKPVNSHLRELIIDNKKIAIFKISLVVQ